MQEGHFFFFFKQLVVSELNMLVLCFSWCGLGSSGSSQDPVRCSWGDNHFHNIAKMLLVFFLLFSQELTVNFSRIYLINGGIIVFMRMHASVFSWFKFSSVLISNMWVILMDTTHINIVLLGIRIPRQSKIQSKLERSNPQLLVPRWQT